MPQLRNIFVFFAAIILTACSSRNVKVVEGVLVVDVYDVKEGEDVAVEGLAEAVEVIPLETVEGAFFEFRGAAMSENIVVIRAANGLVRVFGRDGRFVGLLDGVDERTGVYDIAIDEGRGRIYASTICGDRLLAFDLAGRRQPDIKLPSRTNKAVLAADSGGVALAQFDFTDTPSGFCAAIIGKGGTRHTSRPSLCIPAHNSEGFFEGFNHEIIGSRAGGQLHVMTTFCDTLFRYNASANRIIPELAVNLPNRHGTNIWEAMQDTTQTASWMYATALPRHYIVSIVGANAQKIIVDCNSLTATQANIVSEISQEIHFADGYAYAVLPPKGKENSTLIRWKLSDKPSHKPAPKPVIPQQENAPIAFDNKAAHTAFDLSERGKPEAAMQIIDAAITKAAVKRGHPALAYAYAMKSVLHTQLAQADSADFYRHLVNAPLSIVQQRVINRLLMEIYTAQGDTENAQKFAVAYGTTSDVAQGSEFLTEMIENRERIDDLSQQTKDDSRLRVYLLCALAFVLIAASATILILRRQKRKHIAATRHELQTLMEQRIETLVADKEKSQETTDELRAEMMKNHAIIHRINKASVTRPLSDGEEDLLHRITEMLYPGLADRLQQKAVTPLSKRELSVCFLFRFGVPQPSVAVLLDWKANTFRTVKSHIKRDHFQLPSEKELEDFIAKA